jgi:hypothetical protein
VPALGKLQRHLEQPARPQLLEPGDRHRTRAGGDDDPIIRSEVGDALAAIANDDASLRRTSTQSAASAARDVGVNVDRDDAPAPADQQGEQRRVIAGARADLKHAHALLELELLEHQRHDRRLRRGAQGAP